MSDNEIVIPSQQTYTLTYELSPDETIENSGSYWGVIMVEEIKNLDTLSPQRGVTVTSLIRYAVQIVTHFENNNVKDLEITSVKMDTTKEQNFLSVSVVNKGNYMLKPIMFVELYNEEGVQIYREEIPYQKVYPELCKLFEIPIKGVPQGTYNGVLVADCGDENLFGIEMELTVPKEKPKQ